MLLGYGLPSLGSILVLHVVMLQGDEAVNRHLGTEGPSLIGGFMFFHLFASLVLFTCLLHPPPSSVHGAAYTRTISQNRPLIYNKWPTHS